MKVGFDFRAMQAGHQLRGIGEVLRNAVTELEPACRRRTAS